LSSRSLLETLTPAFRNLPCSARSPDSPKTRHPYPAPCFSSTRASHSRAPGRQAWPTGSAIGAVIPARIPLSLSPFSLFFPPFFFFFFLFSFSHFLSLFFSFLSPSLFLPLSFLLPCAPGPSSLSAPAHPGPSPCSARLGRATTPPPGLRHGHTSSAHPCRTHPRCRAAPRPRAPRPCPARARRDARTAARTRSPVPCCTRAAPAPPRRRVHAHAHARGRAASPCASRHGRPPLTLHSSVDRGTEPPAAVAAWPWCRFTSPLRSRAPLTLHQCPARASLAATVDAGPHRH